MPFSHSSQLSVIVGFIEQCDPDTLLDVGVGMGQYGFLARMNLESLDLFEIDGPRGRLKEKNEWRRRIDGIEGCTIYRNPVHDYAYDRLMIGDALDILPTIPDRRYELVLAIDIVEHFFKSDGERFLAECRRVAGRHVLLSTPKQWIEQVVEPNPYEDHRSLWTEQELRRNGFDRFLTSSESWIAVHSVADVAPYSGR